MDDREQARKRRLVWQEGDVKVSPCIWCIHAHEGPFCDAFPEGIPRTILRRQTDHKIPYPGDHGIQFEPIKQEESAKS